MKNRIPRFAVWLVLTFSLLSSPLAAQNKRNTGSKKSPARVVVKEPLPTFDTLLAANSYKIYGEIRGVGQLTRSAGVNELLDPLMKFAAPPKEFQSLVKWLNSHADELMTSRLLFASWPTRPKLPQFLCAIEFASEEEAGKFEPQLNALLPKLFPTPSPVASVSPQQPATPTKQISSSGPHSPPREETKPPYLLKHSGALVLLTDSPFTLKDLRPADSKLLRDDPNLRTARDRFNSEPVFVYVDLTTEDRSRPEPPRPPARKAEVQVVDEVSDASSEQQPTIIRPEEPVPNDPSAESSPEEPPTPQPTPETETAKMDAERRDAINFAMSGLTRAFFGGPPRWPDAIGIGAAFESESYVIRALLLNSEQNKSVLIPVLPQLMAGPPITPSAPSILPADTEMFITASVDFAAVHDNIIKTALQQVEVEQSQNGQHASELPTPESPFAAYERILGINFKRDLIPVLGNEIALTVPMDSFFGRPPTPSPETPSEPDSKPAPTPEQRAVVVAISLRDREGARALIPKLIDSLGMKGASTMAQKERREDTELVSYAGVFSYALVGDFLVSSSDPKAVRHVVDSYLNHQTLASDSNFHNFTRWQPRQVLGQVYVSTALAESYENYAEAMNSISDEKLRDFITSLTPASEPITYAVANEGFGPLHELRLPRKFVLLLIAGMSSGSEQSSSAANESMARAGLYSILHAEETYKASQGNGRYGSLQELIDAGLVAADTADRNGYKIELILSGEGFEARATPNEYGKSGKRSFFIDQSTVMRGGDHGGGPATVADKAQP